MIPSPFHFVKIITISTEYTLLLRQRALDVLLGI